MLLLVASALATPPGPQATGFAVPSRDDAPTDARIPFDANYVVPAELSAGEGAPETLEVERLDWGRYPSMVVIAPPTSGWTAGADVTVTVTHELSELPSETFELAFGVGVGPAADPSVPEVLDVEISDWSDEELTYPSGCCRPVRTVTLQVRNTDFDAWSLLEVLSPGRAEDDLLVVVIGPGEHTIQLTQWDEDGEVHPAELLVVGTAADGDRSEAVAIDVSEDPYVADAGGDGEDGGDGDAEGCGCDGTSGGGLWVGLVLVAARSRRRVSGV